MKVLLFISMLLSITCLKICPLEQKDHTYICQGLSTLCELYIHFTEDKTFPNDCAPDAIGLTDIEKFEQSVMKKLIKEIKLLTFTIPKEKLQKAIHSSLPKEGKNIEQDEDPKEILPSLHKVGKTKKHVVSSFNKVKEQKEPKETLPFLPQVVKQEELNETFKSKQGKSNNYSSFIKNFKDKSIPKDYGIQSSIYNKKKSTPLSFPSKTNVSPIIPENVNSIKAVPNQESSSSYLNKHTQKSIPKKSPNSFNPKSKKTPKEIQMEEEKKQKTQRYLIMKKMMNDIKRNVIKNVKKAFATKIDKEKDIDIIQLKMNEMNQFEKDLYKVCYKIQKALEEITKQVSNIHFDWMSNVVAGLFNYKVVDIKKNDNNVCSTELCIASISYDIKNNNPNSNFGGHVVYVVNSFMDNYNPGIIITRDQQHKNELLLFESDSSNKYTIADYNNYKIAFVENEYWTNRNIKLDFLQYLKCKSKPQANLPNLPKYKY